MHTLMYSHTPSFLPYTVHTQSHVKRRSDSGQISELVPLGTGLLMVWKSLDVKGLPTVDTLCNVWWSMHASDACDWSDRYQLD